MLDQAALCEDENEPYKCSLQHENELKRHVFEGKEFSIYDFTVKHVN